MRPAEFARRLGVSPQSIYQIQSGHTKQFTSTNNARAAAILGVSALWLATGDGQMHGTPGLIASAMKGSDTSDSNLQLAVASPGRVVPLVSWVRAGSWSEAVDPYSVGHGEEKTYCPVNCGPNTFALRVHGDSMFNPSGSPSVPAGHIIYVDPDRQPAHGNLVVAKLPSAGDATFKRLLVEGGRYFLEALNPSWPNRIMPLPEGGEIVGVVVFSGVSYT